MTFLILQQKLLPPLESTSANKEPYSGFKKEDIYCDKNSLPNQVQQARNALMLEKGFNPSCIQDQEKVTVSNYVAFIEALTKSSHGMKDQFTALFNKLLVTLKYPGQGLHSHASLWQE
eukprot:8719948-Ditylum_brightwellii.AAC.1